METNAAPEGANQQLQEGDGRPDVQRQDSGSSAGDLQDWAAFPYK